MKTLSTFGAILSPANLQYAISNSGLIWVVSPAQWTSIQYWYLHNPTTITVTDKTKIIEISHSHALTMFGIPVEIDKDANPHFVELYLHGELIFRIDGLSIPTGFEQ